MEIKSVKLINAFDRDTGSKLLVNGKAIAAVNYDEHGSAGVGVLEDVLNGLAKMAGIYPETDELPDDEFDDVGEDN